VVDLKGSEEGTLLRDDMKACNEIFFTPVPGPGRCNAGQLAWDVRGQPNARVPYETRGLGKKMKRFSSALQNE
jgi:hypothetical protein